MVDRGERFVEIMLLNESLNCYPPESQAAKIYAKFMAEHPDISPDDVTMRIDSYEREEDYYGNGGGYDSYVRIVKYRPETQEEHDKRVNDEEEKAIKQYANNIRFEVSKLIHEMFGRDATNEDRQRLYDRMSDELRDMVMNIR